jgi:hypothetical protein
MNTLQNNWLTVYHQIGLEHIRPLVNNPMLDHYVGLTFDMWALQLYFKRIQML